MPPTKGGGMGINMNIVDAVWEKRNLGVGTQEISLDESDDISEVKRELENLSADYQIVKVPAGSVKMMWMLEETGFRFIETSIHVVHDLKNLELSGMLDRIDKGITYEPMTEDDIQQMFEEIREGLFYTDRIALDDHFSVSQAANRYVGWIKDELERGTEIFKYLFKSENVGFFTFKDLGDDIYYPFLAGIYKKYQKSPLGLVYLYKPLLEARKRGGKCISTYISTNNSNAVRMHVKFGFTFKEMTYVYVRHKL